MPERSTARLRFLPWSTSRAKRSSVLRSMDSRTRWSPTALVRACVGSMCTRQSRYALVPECSTTCHWGDATPAIATDVSAIVVSAHQDSPREVAKGLLINMTVSAAPSLARPTDAQTGEAPPVAAKRVWTKRRPHAPAIHRIYLYSLSAFIIMQPFIRDYGGLLFVAFVAVAVCHAFATARLVVVPTLVGFTAIGLSYVVLSYANALPDAWTRVFDTTLIPRQAFYVVALYPLVLSAASLWDYAAQTGRTGRVYAVLLVATGLLAAPVEALTEGSRDFVTAYASMAAGGLGNTRLLLYAGLSYFLLVRPSKALTRLYTLLISGALFFVLYYYTEDAQLQNLLAVLVIVAVSFVRPTARFVKLVAVCGAAVYLALIPFAQDIYEWDHNAGYRLALTRDALIGVAESHGLGVGFGKEVVTGEYGQYGIDRTKGMTAPSELAIQGVHNSFAQEFMRLGLVGGAFLLTFFVWAAFPGARGSLGRRRHEAVVYLLVLLAMTVNVALESPTYIVGLAMVVGYLLSGKRGCRARSARTSSSAWAESCCRVRGPTEASLPSAQGGS